MNPALQGLLTIVLGVGGCIGYFYFSNQFLDKVLYPATGPNAGRNINRANQIRPWLFLFPAIFALGLYLAYPVFETLRLSLTDRSQDGAFVGLANYSQMFGEGKFWEALSNNMLWLIVVPAASTAFGLLAAQLTDRIAWGSLAKSLIFMPMAISFVGASVIFKLIYDTRPVESQPDRHPERSLAAVRRRDRLVPVPAPPAGHHAARLRRRSSPMSATSSAGRSGTRPIAGDRR